MFKSQEVSGVDHKCVLVKGIGLEKIPGFPETTILYIQPCASIRGRVNCELRLGIPDKGAEEEFFSFPLLSKLLLTYSDRFAETRISDNLGVARIQWRGKKILIFRNGRIVIREALSESDVHASLDFLSKLLAASVLCDNCEKPLLNCAAGLCQTCSRISTILTKVPQNLLRSQIRARFDTLLLTVSKQKARIERLIREPSLVTPSLLDSDVQTQIVRTARLILDLIVSSADRVELISGIALLRQAWDFEFFANILQRVEIESTAVRTADRNALNHFFRLLDASHIYLQDLVCALDSETIRVRLESDHKAVLDCLKKLKEESEKSEVLTDLLRGDDARSAPDLFS